jgi:very-short-patch-repair endonuclease
MKRTLTQFARKLRKEQTDAEKIIWQCLRNKQMNGNKFRRQFQIDKYIVDFICLNKKLIIELDGGQHANNKKDLKRDAFLKSKGYNIIRIWDNEVMSNKEGVLEMIENIINADAPHPNPLPKVERGK